MPYCTMAGTACRHRNISEGDEYNNYEITSPMYLGGDHKYIHNLMDVLIDAVYH